MKSEEIYEIYFGDVNEVVSPGRREFIKKMGAGLLIILALKPFTSLANLEEEEGKKGKKKTLDFNVYLRIKEDGRVECYTGKIEMGQGITTSLAQALAEELEVPLNSIDMIMGDTELCPYDAGTWGSLTTRMFDPPLRAAAVEARMELLKLASAELDIPEDQLKTEEGNVVSVSDSSNRISYGELTKGKKIVKTVTRPPVFKKATEYKKVGKPIHATNALLKVTGKAMYTSDLKFPGLLYASICRPKSHRSRLLSVDYSQAEQIDGVRVVVIGELVAALHEKPNVAADACKLIKASWSTPKVFANQDTIFDHLVKNGVENRVVQEKGNLYQGFQEAEIIAEMEYHDGYKAHAPIETHAATAFFEEDKLLVWASTQTPFGTQKNLAEKLDMPLEKVHVKQVLLGGGFGGKISTNQAVEAALLAKETGTPVQVAWTREEEFMYDRFRPAAVMQIKAGVTKAGNITAWNYNIYCAGSRGVNDFYGIQNLRSALYDKRGIHPFGTGAWRAPGNNSTTFARESHIDVLANRVEMDPLEFRFLNLSNSHFKRTLKLAADTFAYSRAKTGENRGCGIALGSDAGTYVAIIAEVEVNPDSGEVTVLRMVCAQDMGQVVNPHGAKVQTEGGLTMGLGYALYEDIQFDWGEVKTLNFDSYDFTRFSVTPKIEAVFIDDMNAAPQGGGEPAIICVGGAIANAVFHASGARVTQLPITPERIKAAIREN